jgi:hypothetical protein
MSDPRNIRTQIANAPVATLGDNDFVYALPSVSGNLQAITVANLKKTLGTPTSGVGDPNGTVDGPIARKYYDTTPGSEREWIKTTGLGVLTGWQ